ncbi:MAG: peptidylprolyl isomerase, partial [Microvirgula sp.]
MPEATINDIRIEADTRAELNNATVQELLRQRALAVGLLEDGADDDTRAAALEQLLEQEVS